MADDHRERMEGEGYQATEAANRWFKGWKTLGLFAGENASHRVFQWSGYSSQRAATQIGYIGGAFNITRIDFHVTTKSSEEQTDQPEKLWQARRRFEAANCIKRVTPITFIDSPRRGSTVYLGARSSPRFLRYYGKTREQRFKVEKWLDRYESQNNRAYAPKLYEAFFNGGAKQSFAIDVVTSHLEHLGIPQQWSCEHEPLKMPSTYNAPDDERFIDYMSKTFGKRLRSLHRRGMVEELLLRCGVDIATLKA